jgi:hypothetical protein
MSESVNVYEAKAHLSQLLDRAAAGEEIIIAPTRCCGGSQTSLTGWQRDTLSAFTTIRSTACS